MISDTKAQLIAYNPDCCHTDDLEDLLIWASVNVDQLHPTLCGYITFTLIARNLREKGKIDKAKHFESMGEIVYNEIPRHLRW